MTYTIYAALPNPSAPALCDYSTGFRYVVTGDRARAWLHVQTLRAAGWLACLVPG